VSGLLDGIADLNREAVSQPIECEIDDWRRIEREQLAEDEPADDGYTEWTPQFGADTAADGKWQSAK
jgi:hypothetical protein